jgi:endonuclease YncB( thermonuclease family)
VLAAIALGAAAIAAWMIWQRSSVSPSGQIIEVIDGDTVRLNGAVYRLVGFDTPERGDKARCDDERRRAEAATTRLGGLIAGGDARLIRVSHGQEGRSVETETEKNSGTSDSRDAAMAAAKRAIDNALDPKKRKLIPSA